MEGRALLVDLGSTTSNAGTGVVDREEEINLRVAAVVTQRLPNGNLVLYGRQEVRVNFEVREVVVGGVIRPQDISASNTVGYDQMAEARRQYQQVVERFDDHRHWQELAGRRLAELRQVRLPGRSTAP